MSTIPINDNIANELDINSLEENDLKRVSLYGKIHAPNYWGTKSVVLSDDCILTIIKRKFINKAITSGLARPGDLDRRNKTAHIQVTTDAEPKNYAALEIINTKELTISFDDFIFEHDHIHINTGKSILIDTHFTVWFQKNLLEYKKQYESYIVEIIGEILNGDNTGGEDLIYPAANVNNNDRAYLKKQPESTITKPHVSRRSKRVRKPRHKKTKNLYNEISAQDVVIKKSSNCCSLSTVLNYTYPIITSALVSYFMFGYYKY